MSDSGGRLAELAAPLREARFRRTVAAFLVSELGDGIAVVVLPIAVQLATGQGWLVGVAFAISQGSSLLARPIGGLLADRRDRAAVLRWSWLARASVLLLGLAAPSDPALLAALLAVTVVGHGDNPSAEALVRERAGQHVRAVATIRRIGIALATLVGPAVGGVLVTLASVEMAVAVDLATFLIALPLLPRGRTKHDDSDVTGQEELRGPSRVVGDAVVALRVDVRQALRHVGGDPVLRLVTATAGVHSALVALLLTAAVVYLDKVLTAPDGAYGLAIAGYAAGSLVGLLVAGTIRWQTRATTIIARSAPVYGLVCALGIAVADWRVLALSWALWGLAYGPEEITSDTALVTRTSTGLLGRVYAGHATISALGATIGALLGGILTDVIGARPTILTVAVTYLVVASPALWSADRRISAEAAT